MTRYSLAVSAPFKTDCDNKATIVSLTQELLKLVQEFGGHGDPGCHSTAVCYERRYIDLVDRDHQLEAKVDELSRKYFNHGAQFTLVEYTRERVRQRRGSA